MTPYVCSLQFYDLPVLWFEAQQIHLDECILLIRKAHTWSEGWGHTAGVSSPHGVWGECPRQRVPESISFLASAGWNQELASDRASPRSKAIKYAGQRG